MDDFTLRIYDTYILRRVILVDYQTVKIDEKWICMILPEGFPRENEVGSCLLRPQNSQNR